MPSFFDQYLLNKAAADEAAKKKEEEKSNKEGDSNQTQDSSSAPPPPPAPAAPPPTPPVPMAPANPVDALGAGLQMTTQGVNQIIESYYSLIGQPAAPAPVPSPSPQAGSVPGVSPNTPVTTTPSVPTVVTNPPQQGATKAASIIDTKANAYYNRLRQMIGSPTRKVEELQTNGTFTQSILPSKVV